MQGSLTLVVVTVFLTCYRLAPELVAQDRALHLGVGGVVALTVVTGLVPWERLPRLAEWTIPVLDFVAIAPITAFAGTMLNGAWLLMGFPVVWLAATGIHPVLAVVVGVLGSAFVSWFRYLTGVAELAPEEYFRPMLSPFYMLGLGIITSIVTRNLATSRAELESSLAESEAQQRLLEQVLAESEKQKRLLETVLETATVGIVVTDQHGNDLIMNSAQRRNHLIGVPPGLDDAAEEELILYEADGKTVIPPDDRPVCRAIKGEQFEGLLITMGDAPGQQTMSVAAQPMRDRHGNLEGTVVIFQNVTELMRAIRARDRFVADVTHEFRTPLTSIIGYLELAREEELDPVVDSYLRIVHRNSERLLGLVSTLLDSASETDGIVLRQVDLVRLLQHGVDSAKVRAVNARLRLETQFPDELTVVADRQRMAQVIDNLISNAIKYTEPGGLITVSARHDGDWAEFTVEDDGIGMSPEEATEAFEGFYRTEQVRRRAIPGTGLGLSIAKAFVREHGGDITLQSTLGAGSRFIVRIPVSASVAASH